MTRTARFRTLEPPASGNRITYDFEIAGFLWPPDHRGWRAVLHLQLPGARLRARIAAHHRQLAGLDNPDSPREQAKSLRRQVDAGADPMADRHTERAAPTVAAMAERYLKDHVSKKAPRSVAEDRALLRQLILPRIGRLRVQAVKRQDIEAFHRSIPTRSAPTARCRC